MDTKVAGLIVCFAILIVASIGLVIVLGQMRDALAIPENRVYTGTFESLTIEGTYITIQLDNSTVTFYQHGGYLGTGANSQVPFIKGHTYELTFAVHGKDLATQYLTLQSVVEVP